MIDSKQISKKKSINFYIKFKIPIKNRKWDDKYLHATIACNQSLMSSGHSDGIGSQHEQTAHFADRLVARSAERRVNALLDLDVFVGGDLLEAIAQRSRVDLAHGWEARSEALVVVANQWVLQALFKTLFRLDYIAYQTISSISILFLLASSFQRFSNIENFDLTWKF